MHKKLITIAQIIFVIGIIFSVIYIFSNRRYTPSVIRSSNKLYDPSGTMQEYQQELWNMDYFNNGKEQGYLDARCNSWLCSYNIDERKWRGTIANPIIALKINGHRLTKEDKMYYNSGYIKSYTEICSRYRSDCEARIQKMRSDYKNYFNASLYDVDKNNHFILVQ